MSAYEWGTLGNADDHVGGDTALASGAQRSFVTASPAGFPQVVTVSAVPSIINPGGDLDDPAEPRDVLEVTTVDTYLMGADLIDGDPFDSETEYAWPVDYWPGLEEGEQPSVDAMQAVAHARIRDLPQSWIDAMPTPPADTLLNGEHVLPCAACAGGIGDVHTFEPVWS